MPTLLEQEEIALTLGDTFSAENNFAELVFQRSKPVLDTELVEMQRIASYREKLRAMLFGTLFLDTAFKVTEKVGADNDFTIQPGEFSSGSLLYTLKAAFDYSAQVITYPLTRKFLWNSNVRVPALTTPANFRVDLVVLTLVTREINGTEDPSFVNPIVNRETAIRTKIEAGISVLEGFAGDVALLDNYFTYENKDHCFRFPLAMIHREAGNSKITSSMLIDLRSRVVAKTDVVPLLKNGGLEIPGDFIVDGNFTVKGTQTIIETTELDVKDNIVRLNKGATGEPSLDSGIEIVRGSSPNSRLLWNESVDRWSCGILGALHTIAFDDEVVHLQGEETIQGVKTFSLPPKSATNPSVDDDFSRKGYVDSELFKGLAKKLDKTLLATKGDMPYADTTGTPATLSAGSEKQVLTIVDGLPVWRNAEAGQAQLDSVLAQAKDYTDQAMDGVPEAIVSGDEATLSSAKSYTDQATSNIGDITTLKSYFVNGVAKLAAKLATAIKINSVSFDGSASISIDHLEDYQLTGTYAPDICDEILGVMDSDPANISVHRVFSSDPGFPGAPDSASSWRYTAFRVPGGNLKVTAEVPGGKSVKVKLYSASTSTWESSWTEVINSSGSAVNSSSLGSVAASLWAKLTDLASYATTVALTALTTRVSKLETLVMTFQTASASFVLASVNTMWLSNSTGALTFTIPTNASAAIPVGSTIEVMRYSTGTLLIAPASGVSLYSYGASVSASYYITGRWAVVTLIKVATNTWVVVGDVSTT